MTHSGTRYRLRLYDGEHELLARQHHEITLPDDRRHWAFLLAAALEPMLRQARAVDGYCDAPRLVVCDLNTGAHLLDWAA